eukprot:gnl/MRDRNA2_/MRDRNA2_102585_c0_seq1.p1 gnl/MRDRNA2_/MRDRNA2_102585_c0~~gnl/MRDRNA2_/MRDRNA2_102585_c0_seq1.p1  ORF type:complete len:367 (-),score=26.40 gnl/MRDRNA2_/MRDRNA2_102585_c0_seq1:5-1105(-)
MATEISYLSTASFPWTSNCILSIFCFVFFAFNVSIDPKYVGLRAALHSLSQRPRSVLLELCGFVIVTSTIAAGLLFCPTGFLSTADDLQDLRTTDEHLFKTRLAWPILLHPDSLVVCEELFLALGAGLMFARGLCNHESKVLVLALVLMTIARMSRFWLWCTVPDYAPEGPIGGRFAIGCVCLALLMLLPALLCSVWKSVTSAKEGIIELSLIVLLFNISTWIIEENHMVASESDAGNLAFSLVDALDSFAAPLLVWATCENALRMPNLNGAFLAVLLGHVFSLVWFLDFSGSLEDPNSQDPYTMASVQTKAHIMTLVHGHPFAILGFGSFTRAASGCIACITYNVLRFSALESSKPVHLDDEPIL